MFLAQLVWETGLRPVNSLQDTGNVESAIKEAETACADGTAGECAAAWDSVSCGICRLLFASAH